MDLTSIIHRCRRPGDRRALLRRHAQLSLSPSNRQLNDYRCYLSSCIDASDRIHIIWSESGDVFYTRLDRFGNTLIDDLLLEHGSFAGNYSAAIGCDAAGNSHMIWDCSDS